ncbi:hypothetical protein AN639_05425 [Candidatus Epulonipiscium fishelsonii]|uniref:Uncharacterized protein n=1 Tax=Candidatus Epulonipiscium fishelsonii TaxID=77094 RepID=A0ACC8XAS6_9FIRM|nr:hypothetical protein AN396_08320 [Epulopiscium sp. SCG-B11WGA-EpuloA1]ONI40145.1 hypothetical protein AN639_05425 [Epulopiscium sp. SCG-B05WGA-EpuloA1]
MNIINNFFGFILNLIFEAIVILFPIGALGLTIIVFTLIVRVLMTPLQIKQQRSMRMTSKLQPELQAIQRKYANKKDQQSQMAQSQEMQALYKKYNINPMAGCLPLIIQLPLLYAVYAVLRQPSHYISKLQELYLAMAAKLTEMVPTWETIMNSVLTKIPMSSSAVYELEKIDNGGTLADKLSLFTTAQWEELISSVPQNVADSFIDLLEKKNNFEWFIFNLVDSPAHLVESGNYFAIIVPILAGLSTFIFTKITMANSKAMQAEAAAKNGNTVSNPTQDSAESMMKTMNMMMPIMMGFFSYTVSSGLALYWIAGNVISMIQQKFVNELVRKEEIEFERKIEEERKAREAELAAARKKKKKKKKPQNQVTEQNNVNIDKPKQNKETRPKKETKQDNVDKLEHEDVLKLEHEDVPKLEHEDVLKLDHEDVLKLEHEDVHKLEDKDES